MDPAVRLTRLAVVVALAAVAIGGSASATPRTEGDWARTAIAAARRTSGILSVFPRRPSTIRCRIPRGGPRVAKVPGFCRTSVRRRDSRVTVTFFEAWNAADFRGPRSPRSGRLTHTWRFVESRSARILSEHTAGDFPPQWVR